jgi:hydrogenase maturation protease
MRSGSESSEPSIALLVLGLGNLLCRDDGAGVRAVEWIRQRYEPDAGVRLLDGGTLGLALLHYLAAAERVILVDAVAADARPGSLLRLRGEEVGRAASERLSPHQIGVGDLLEAARLLDRLPDELSLLGVVPEDLGLGLELSPGVEARIAELGELVVAEAAALGHPFRRTD